MSQKRCYYEVLGVAREVAPDDIRAAEVTRLEAANKLLTARVERLEKLLADQSSTSSDLALAGMTTEVTKLRNEIKRLRDDFDAMKKTADATPPPNTTSKREDAEARGKVLIQNDYLEEMLIVVNGAQYRLPPGQTRTIQVPSGTFSYQVPQLQSVAQSRRVATDETYTIRVHPMNR